MSGLLMFSRRIAAAALGLARRCVFSLLPALVLAGVSCSPIRLAASDQMPGEQSMRSAMLFNFLKFTEFPRLGVDKSRDIQICISVRDNIQAAALAALSGRKVAGRELLIVDFVMRSGDCQVLYVDSRQRWNALATHPALRGALTISAYAGFADEGGMIEIGRLDDGIRFDVNLAQARRAGFHFSPQMLLLARKVHE
jgi:hypothetical protein